MSDLSEMYNINDIRESLPDIMSYTPKSFPHPSSKSENISCEITTEFIEVDGMESHTPIAYAPTIDIADAVHDDKIRHTHPVTGVVTDYTVKGVQPDGEGLTRLVLEII